MSEWERERRYSETDWLNKMSIYRADCGVTPWELGSRQKERALAQLHLRSTPANLRSYIPWWTCTCTKTSALSKMEKQERHFAIDRTLTTTKLNLPPFNILSHPSLPFCWLSQMSPLLQSICQVSVSLSGLTGDGGGPRVVVMCLGRRITEFPRFIRAEMLSFTDALDTLELTYCGFVRSLWDCAAYISFVSSSYAPVLLVFFYLYFMNSVAIKTGLMTNPSFFYCQKYWSLVICFEVIILHTVVKQPFKNYKYC